MAWQLIYTSSPHCLRAGQTGFGTVARHREIRGRIVEDVERASSYERAGGLAQSKLLPWIASHRIITIGGERYHVLSSIRDCGHDYSGRTNHIAHHLICEDAETASAPDPASILLGWGGWRAGWHEAPRYLGRGDIVNLAAVGSPTSLPAMTWARVTGEAGNAGILHEESEFTLLSAAGEERQLLALFGEASAITPGSPWDHTFTTFMKASDRPTDFQWRGVIQGSVAAKRADSGGTLLDLTRPLDRKCTQFTLSEHARTGFRPASRRPSGGAEPVLLPPTPPERGMIDASASIPHAGERLPRFQEGRHRSEEEPRLSAKAWAQAQAAKVPAPSGGEQTPIFRIAGILLVAAVAGLAIAAVLPRLAPGPGAWQAAPQRADEVGQPASIPAPRDATEAPRSGPGESAAHDAGSHVGGKAPEGASARAASQAAPAATLPQPMAPPPIIPQEATASAGVGSGTVESPTQPPQLKTVTASATAQSGTAPSAARSSGHDFDRLVNDPDWLPDDLIVILSITNRFEESDGFRNALEKREISTYPVTFSYVYAPAALGRASYIIYSDINKTEKAMKVGIESDSILIAEARLEDMLWLHWGGGGRRNFVLFVPARLKESRNPILRKKAASLVTIDEKGLRPAGAWAKGLRVPGWEFKWDGPTGGQGLMSDWTNQVVAVTVTNEREAISSESATMGRDQLNALCAITNLFGGEFSRKLAELKATVPTPITAPISVDERQASEWRDLTWPRFHGLMEDLMGNFLKECDSSKKPGYSTGTNELSSALENIAEPDRALSLVMQGVDSRKKTKNPSRESEIENATMEFRRVWNEAFTAENVKVLAEYRRICKSEKPSTLLKNLGDVMAAAGNDGSDEPGRVVGGGRIAKLLVRPEGKNDDMSGLTLIEFGD